MGEAVRCNDRRYARIAAAEGGRVVALDSDQGPQVLYGAWRGPRSRRYAK